MTCQTEADFVARYGGIYEHSPWIAAACWPAVQSALESVDLAALMARQVDTADRATQLALIRAHPDLAGRLAVAGNLTQASAVEQASAGLDQCSAEEFHEFQQLNTAYVEKFGFPFVMAVRGSHRRAILKAFASRLRNSYEDEFNTALSEIHKIARLRLEQLDP